MRVEIVVPMTPSKRLSPNKGLDKRWKSKDVAALRETAFYAASEALRGMATPVFSGDVELCETIYWGKGERKTDLDALPLMLKGAVDGAVDAGLLVNDSQVVRLVVTQAKAADGIGRTELVIESAV